MATKKQPKAPELITAYKFVPARCGDLHQQWDAKAKTFSPFSKLSPKKRAELGAHEWLDALTHPVEAGVAPKFGWVKYLFGTEKVFFEFVERYRGYDDEYRTNDRWFTALAALADTVDDAGFVRSSEICDVLITQAQETGQIKAD